MPYLAMKKGVRNPRAIFKTKKEAEKAAKAWPPNVSYRIIKITEEQATKLRKQSIRR